ncbi:unnamed protein product [Ambrosiozyma monospora]|uniref:Unnamed protein product n=1 Tax=Ambrosiozyma monospora TaxID=43982 RepID=A0ACB5U8E0_AMBMO|nr:unnamed protein product [Ambrosiozyma monospora]
MTEDTSIITDTPTSNSQFPVSVDLTSPIQMQYWSKIGTAVLSSLSKRDMVNARLTDEQRKNLIYFKGLFGLEKIDLSQLLLRLSRETLVRYSVG